MRKTLTLILSVMLVTSICGCTLGKSSQVTVLRIGVIPITKTLPLHVAVQEGYFRSEGVTVEIIPFSSARERDAAFQAGELDGASMDLIAVALLNNGGLETRAVRTDSHEMASWAILSSPNSTIRSPKELSGVPIAVSHNTVIEFVTSQLLEGEGLVSNEVQFVEISAISARMEMLSQDQVQASTLPEPLASLAIQRGAHVIMDDTQHSVPPTVIAFRETVLEENPEAVRAFLRAIEQAVNAINVDPVSYTELFFRESSVPDSLHESILVPEFSPAMVPSPDQVQRVITWMVTKEMLQTNIVYERMVDGSYLP